MKNYLGVMIVLIGTQLFGQTTTQEVTATDGKYLWETSANWTNSIPTGSPTAITNANVDITVAVGNEIYTSTALTFANNGNNSDEIIVNGLLVVDGDLFFDNNSLVLTINSGGTVIVLGNMTSNNKADINNGGQLLVTGNLTLNGGNFDYNDNNGGTPNLWVGGTIGGSNGSQVAAAAADDEPNLNSGTFPQATVDIVEASILPVELTKFYSQKSDNAHELKWETATEINNDFFSVQRSENGKDFYEIGVVDGNGTTTEPQSYSFTDQSPVATTEYYRLKQVDFDGAFEIHPTIVVFSDAFESNARLEVYPNPAREQVNLKAVRPIEYVELVLLDLSGKIVANLRENSNGSGLRLEAKLPVLEKGLYHIRYQTATGEKGVEKLIIR